MSQGFLLSRALPLRDDEKEGVTWVIGATDGICPPWERSRQESARNEEWSL